MNNSIAASLIPHSLVATDAGPRLLYDWLAEKLARRLNVDVSQLPQPYSLNDVVCWFLGERGRREEAYVRLVSTNIALALTAQGRGDEAAKILEPVVKRRRDLQSRNHGDMDTPTSLAIALYAEAANDSNRRAALLREAAALIDGTPAEYRNLKTTRLWRDRIAQAQRGQFPWTGRGKH